jgi:hypothetical protein
MIFRIYPVKDTSITNYKRNNVPQTSSNSGLSEILQLFKIAGVSGSLTSSATGSFSRILLKFDVSELRSLLTASLIPLSDVSYKLILKDAQHNDTLPSSYDIEIFKLARDWDEGKGHDIDSFSDKGFANWDKAKSNQFWTSPGGDTTGSHVVYHFDSGFENVDADISDFVDDWVVNDNQNNGVLLKVSSSLESDYEDYFVKKFHSKHTFFKDLRPYVEARWDDSTKDDRSNFYFDYTGSLLLYNIIDGQFSNVVGASTGSDALDIRITDLSGTILSTSASYSGKVGIYSASFAIPFASYSGSEFYDIWSINSKTLMTGSFTPVRQLSSQVVNQSKYVVSMPSLKNEYNLDELTRFRTFIRRRSYNPAVVSSSSINVQSIIVPKAYYRIDNDRTKEQVVGFGTGSLEWTRMSYDSTGNFFDFYINSLSSGNVYRIIYLFNVDGQRQIIDNNFKFRVV